jgi:limonene-1,2-epoxide hydrolase
MNVPSPDAYASAAAFVSRFAERWSAPEPERFRDLLDPETRNLYPGMAEPQGPDGIVEWLTNAIQTFPDLRLEVTRWATDREAVLIEFDASATIGDRLMGWQGVDRFLLKGGRCIEGRSYYDTGPIRKALAAASPTDA